MDQKLSSGERAVLLTEARNAIKCAVEGMSLPKLDLEKYSALLCPNAWPSSSGRLAMDNIISAMIAPARLTMDSSASESKPTEPVNK